MPCLDASHQATKASSFTPAGVLRRRRRPSVALHGRDNADLAFPPPLGIAKCCQPRGSIRLNLQQAFTCGQLRGRSGGSSGADRERSSHGGPSHRRLGPAAAAEPGPCPLGAWGSGAAGLGAVPTIAGFRWHPMAAAMQPGACVGSTRRRLSRPPPPLKPSPACLGCCAAGGCVPARAARHPAGGAVLAEAAQPDSTGGCDGRDAGGEPPAGARGAQPPQADAGGGFSLLLPSVQLLGCRGLSRRATAPSIESADSRSGDRQPGVACCSQHANFTPAPCSPGASAVQALQTFELRPTYEDVFQVETATVEEYLQQVGAASWDE